MSAMRCARCETVIDTDYFEGWYCEGCGEFFCEECRPHVQALDELEDPMDPDLCNRCVHAARLEARRALEARVLIHGRAPDRD